MSTIHRLARFHEHLKESGYGGRNVFEEAIGKKPGYLTNALKRESSIGSDVLETLSKIFPDLNLEWLLTGEGSMLKSEVQHTASLSPPQKQDSLDDGEEVETKEEAMKRLEDHIDFLEDVIRTKEGRIVNKDFTIRELTQKVQVLTQKVQALTKEVEFLKDKLSKRSTASQKEKSA